MLYSFYKDYVNWSLWIQKITGNLLLITVSSLIFYYVAFLEKPFTDVLQNKCFEIFRKIHRKNACGGAPFLIKS